MPLRKSTDAPQNRRGDGQISRLLLSAGQFGSRHLAVTWVDGAPGSQQALHAHPDGEQVYVIVRGHGHMLIRDEHHDVEPGDLAFIPPDTDHAIRATGPEPLAYVSATSPPFPARIDGANWTPGHTSRAEEQ